MQTQLAPQYQGTAAGEQADRVLRSCVHCGFCNATCPTYKLTGNELDGPRGRIYLMKQVFEGHTPTATTQAHLDRCIGCRHCESTCPSGVQYHELLSVGQAVVDSQVQRPWRQALSRAALRAFIPSPAFGPMLKLGRWVRPFLPHTVAKHIPASPTTSAGVWPKVDAAVAFTGRVLMPQGCVQPHLRPHVDTATARVLAAMGLLPVAVRGAACCGALKGHLGDVDGAKAQARRNIDAWWLLIHSDAAALPVQAIVVNASGCGAWSKDYAELLTDDAAYADKAKAVSALIRDPAQLLAEHLPALQQRLQDLPKPLARMAFQPPCSFSHALKLSAANKPGPVENGLRALGFGLHLPTSDSHQCCGAGGAYSLLQPELSAPLKAAKVDALMATQPDVIVSANIGCITHLQSDVPVPVKHWIEVLDEALQRQP